MRRLSMELELESLSPAVRATGSGGINDQVAAADAAAAANDEPQQQRLQRQLTPRGTRLEQVSQVYECQRWYGVLWQAPLALLDHPDWADDEGKAVALPLLPPEEPSAWEAVVSDATDGEGWQYATVFSHLGFKRPGGRASQRLGDLVRRRLWRRRHGAPTAPALVSDDGSPYGGTAGVAQRAMASMERVAADAEAQRKAIKHFLGLILDMLSRRSLYSLVPWDPTALIFLFRKHQEVLQELQLAAARNRIFGPNAPPPPSPLRPSSAGHNLLQDLLCACQHSRAAYGFAMHAGHFESIKAYVRLQTLQPLQFDAVGGVSVEANNEAVAALAGLEHDDILWAAWRNAPMRPCHYVAIDRANEVVVISIRGSLQMGDLLSDLSAAPFDHELDGVHGHVHPGMLAAATYVQCCAQRALEQAAARCPGWPVLVTGHSLGGGVAALLAALLRHTGLPRGLGPVHAICLGTPAVMSEPLAAACESYVTSVILGADVIPHLSAWSVEALLLEANAASPVQRAVRELKTRLEARLGDALNTALDAVLGPGGGRSGVGGGLQNGGGMVRSASEAAQARSGGAAGLAGVLSLLGSGDQDAAGAAQWQQQEQQVRNIAMIDLSQGESEATAGAGGSSSGAARPPQAVRVLREPTPEPKLVAAVAGADLPGTALPAASSEPARQQRGAAEQAVAVAAAAAQSAAQEDDTSVVEPESVSQLVPGVEAAGLEGFFEQMTPEPLLQRQQQQQQQKEDSNAGRSPELLHYGGGDPDAPAVATALAQQQASSRLVAGSEAVSASEPEVLLPPGRLIWLFREAPPQEARVATDGGEVDVAAAMEAVEQRGGAGAGSAAADQQGREEGVALACSYGATVAAIAERHTFSRILLSPSMMEDHVPDAYLRALSAL